MYYIVALGNPGRQYEKTRHNLGWQVVNALVEEQGLPSPRTSTRVLGRVTEGELAGERVSILYPDTFMNNSGEAVAAFVPTDKRSSMIVVHDEVALPLGAIRISVGSSAGGHNGVRSIIERCGTADFIRVRLGVGAATPPMPLESHVLSRFLPEEEIVVRTMMSEALGALQTIVSKGVTEAMNIYNEQKQGAS